MGATWSVPLSRLAGWSSNEEQMALPGIPENPGTNDDEKEERQSRLKQEMEDFKGNLEKKREERKQAISRISEELSELRTCKEELEKERVLREGLEKHVKALKEVQTVSTEMLQLRETQVAALKKKLQDMELSTDQTLAELRTRYEQQMENVRTLRQLYEERSEAMTRAHQSELERERAKSTLLELRLSEVGADPRETEQFTSKVEELENALEQKEEEIRKEKDLRYSTEAECRNLTSQLDVINNLFSNMLIGNDLDFDFLTQLLQENHNLITDLIANGDLNETAAVLFDIAEKAYKKSENEVEATASSSLSTKEEIASNLPKVWRVLVELLSRHECNTTNAVQGNSQDCYRRVQTPHGSRTVISVSQTFLRLKDLILEKNCLVKEVGRLKTLNGHLENRLDLQERRLGVVCSELRKTWGVVSKLKVQHRQLHTHEKILRYELQHKRQLLTDLKHELQYCKETWARAREKNTQTEHDWELLRKEFAMRKSQEGSNSGESGYEDDQSPDISTSDSDDIDTPESQASMELEEEPSEFEDGSSDATVIELIDDMLDVDSDEITVPEESQSLLDEIQNDISIPFSSDDPNVSEIAQPTSTGPQSSAHEMLVQDCPQPSAIPSTSGEAPAKSTEEMFSARAQRLRRLEMQCRSLLNQMTLTSLRSDTLSTRLEELHEQYGSEDSGGRRVSTTNEQLPSTSEAVLELSESVNSSDHWSSERVERIQRMEQECLDMFDNATANTVVEFDSNENPSESHNESLGESVSNESGAITQSNDSYSHESTQ